MYHGNYFDFMEDNGGVLTIIIFVFLKLIESQLGLNEVYFMDFTVGSADIMDNRSSLSL